MPREVFRREVEKELTGREEEPSELIYFKVYPDPGDRAGDRDGSEDAGYGQIPRLPSGDDLRRLPSRSQSGKRRSADAAVCDGEVLQVSARRAAAGISWRPEREGPRELDWPKTSALAAGFQLYEELRNQVLRRDGRTSG